MKIAAIADLHCKTSSAPDMRDLLEGVDRHADVLVLAGDLTNRGLPGELETLLGEVRRFSLPTVAVLGNHDHESDCAERLVEMLVEEGINVLEGTTCVIDGVGFAGTKGFCGGFGKYAVHPIGERALKSMLQEGIDEAKHLEQIVCAMDTVKKIAVLHYAPIPETLQGEPPELYAFLGTSHLAEAIDRCGVDVAIHGHAHNGSPDGSTPAGIKVHNVSRFVRRKRGLPPYLILEI